jgi:hypothetical protein
MGVNGKIGRYQAGHVMMRAIAYKYHHGPLASALKNTKPITTQKTPTKKPAAAALITHLAIWQLMVVQSVVHETAEIPVFEREYNWPLCNFQI